MNTYKYKNNIYSKMYTYNYSYEYICTYTRYKYTYVSNYINSICQI